MTTSKKRSTSRQRTAKNGKAATARSRKASVANHTAGPENNRPELIWNEDDSPYRNYCNVAKRLNESGRLFRAPEFGLIHGDVNSDPKHIKKAADLLPIVVDNLDVYVMKNGKAAGSRISQAHLNAMLKSQAFLNVFRPVDVITSVPLYLSDFSLTRPGYNHSGDGYGIFYLGDPADVHDELPATQAFLDAMDFDSNASRTNAVALALTASLRNHFHGGKPVAIVTANKSHSGKDTVILFGAGIHQAVSISYQGADWSVEKTFNKAVKELREIGMVIVENARLDSRDSFISSAFLERFVTDRNPFLAASGTGESVRRPNDIVTAISTNYGHVSEDLLNRGLPIHLEARGDITHRQSPIGNPKLEYLPRHKETIAAELRGMIERWKAAGMPLDNEARHPFSVWAKTIGGILQVNGFTGFLANYGTSRTTIDPVRQHLGLLGAMKPGEWLTPTEWARLAVQGGHKRVLIPAGDQDTEAGQARGIGTVLTAHADETFETETETSTLMLRLHSARKRLGQAKNPTKCYRFEVLSETLFQEEEQE